jgi:DNA-binding transcriptional regulator YiaG
MEYKYTESGLDNVIIRNMPVITDDAGEQVYRIPNVVGLHKLIAHCVITHQHGISPKELRFLRTEMGMTQGELGQIVKKDHQTVGRWERGETPIDENAELIVRMIACEKLDIDPKIGVTEMAKRCVPTAEIQIIEIDGTDPERYQPVRLAA